MLKEIMDSSMIIEAKTSKVITIFIFSLVIALILFLSLAFKYKFYLYEYYLGYVIKVDDSYYIALHVEDNKIPSFEDYVIIIGEKEVDFKILEIEREYYFSDNKKYHLIVIETEIKEEKKIKNNIINLKFKLEETNLINQIRKGMKF